MIYLVGTIGIIPLLLMIYRVAEKKEFGWVLVIPFYFIALAYFLYWLESVLP